MSRASRSLDNGCEMTLLNKPSHERCKASTLRAFAKGSRAVLRKKTKSILVQAILASRSSPNAEAGNVAMVWETIRGKCWSNALRLWLQEDRFLELARSVTLSQKSDKILAFVVALQNFPDEPELLGVLYKLCEKIVQGNSLTPQFLKRFKFTVYDRSELCNLTKKMEDKCAILKKLKLDPDQDALAVIYTSAFTLFDEFGGWKMEEDVEEVDSSRNQEESEQSVM